MKPLRVLHVNTEDVEGGAARAAQRIHKALWGIGVDSHVLVLNQRESAPHVLQGLNRAQQELHRVKLALSVRRMRRQHTPTNKEWHSLNWLDSGLANWINRSNFDVVNLHWVGAEMLSVEEIGRIRKPLVWTMHDMWPICGAEHYDDLQYPGRYRSSYTAATRPPNQTGPDLDAWVWRRKRKAWANQHIHLISPSRWLAECVSNSSLMTHQRCSVIPNCLDTHCFKHIDRQQARQILCLDPTKRYVLFGAMSSTNNLRKGFHLLQPALRRLSSVAGMADRTELLVFGAHTPSQPPPFGLKAHYLGNFQDEVSLALLYAAADVFVAPSLMDNLPNTVLESIACGTPCVAFDVGGMPDLIEHGINGWLAPPFSADALAQGLEEILMKWPTSGKSDFRKSCIEKYSNDSVARQYLSVYEGICSAK